MSQLTVKQGDTLTIDGTRTSESGTAVSLDNVTIDCEMVRLDTRQALTTEILSAADGTFRLSLTPTQTEALTPGSYSTDVQFTDGAGQVISTDTFPIRVLEDITNAAS